MAMPFGYAVQSAIPINGRYGTQVIGIRIPPYPRWAHDVVLNATIAWNNAQTWYSGTNASARFIFLETDYGTATVSFEMPEAVAGIAVGWTDYKYAAGSGSIITSTRTYLDSSIFNQAQEGNETARRYAFWLALHELGRVLGLGSVLDGQDIMDPMARSERVSETPKLSTLDLYAIHLLALGYTPAFVILRQDRNVLIDARIFLTRS